MFPVIKFCFQRIYEPPGYWRHQELEVFRFLQEMRILRLTHSFFIPLDKPENGF